MTIHQNSFGENMGDPNLGALAYLQDNWGPSEISAAMRVAKAAVVPSGGNIEVDIPVGAEIFDVQVICTASNGSGTVTIKTNADTPVAITDAIACATVDAIDKATTIDTTYSKVTADGVIAVPNGNGDSGDVFISYKK